MSSYEEFETWNAVCKSAEKRPQAKTSLPKVVEFVTIPDDAGLKFLPPAEVPTVKARVLGNHRIVVDADVFTGGDVFDAPHNDETRLWLRQGYIELVPETSKKGK